MYVFYERKYKKSKIKERYNNFLVKFVQGSIILSIDTKQKKRRKKIKQVKKENSIDVRGVKKELLEYKYGIYRMFPCGKQFQYHMQWIHVNGVTERSIR